MKTSNPKFQAIETILIEISDDAQELEKLKSIAKIKKLNSIDLDEVMHRLKSTHLALSQIKKIID